MTITGHTSAGARECRAVFPGPASAGGIQAIAAHQVAAPGRGSRHASRDCRPRDVQGHLGDEVQTGEVALPALEVSRGGGLPADSVLVLIPVDQAFDAITQKNHSERIKTIGHGYMCAGGIPKTNQTHAIDICLCAIEIREFVKRMKQQSEGLAWDIRIGVNSGPVTAGIVGKSKISYDIWGETVNLASRHESSGVSAEINVSKFTYLLTKGLFQYEPRGEVEIKGGGRMEMYLLKGLRPEFRSNGSENPLFAEAYSKVADGTLLLGYDI